jgi:ferredoxin-nitrate reductase
MSNNESRTVRTTCSYCGVGCGIIATRDRSGRLSVKGDADHPSSQGMLCSKGRALHHVVQDHSDRILYPQMRRSRAHPMERVDWTTAIQRAAAVFRSIIQRYGPDAAGLYISGQCLTEEYYVANKLMKGFIGSNNIDTNSRLCMSSAVAAYKLALGDDACPISYSDIELCDCFLVAGANPAWCHPILYRRLEKRKVDHPETKLIVMDPRRTQSCAIADLHLQIQPGTDVAAFNAIARELIEHDWIDHAFVQGHTNGLEAMREAAFALSVDEAAGICRVPAADLRLAARWIGEARAFQSWWAMGLNQSAMGVDKNLALLNLSLLTGQIGRPGAGPLSLTGQPNAMGGREVGGMAHLLAAHHDLANPAHREKVARFWGVDRVSEKPGLTATEMFDALETGKLRAIWIVCTNPAVSLPDLARAERALKKAPFVIVQDISNRADTAAYADLLLPAAGWLEKSGTMTNSERRISLLEKLTDPPGEALPDAEIFCRFAKEMGWEEHFDYAAVSDIFDEHCALTRGTAIDISGLSHARLKREGTVQWPCPAEDHPGTPRLFVDAAFYTPDGRAALHGVGYAHRSEALSSGFPFVLTTGRIRDQWHTMTRTGKVGKLNQQYDAPFVEVHPDDAAAAGLVQGGTARVHNARGEVLARVEITDAIKLGTVFLPMHWGKAFQGGAGRANLLTSPLTDARSKEPDFKYAAVAVAPVPVQPQRIVVIGTGAAALHFIQCYRERNRLDEIIVFGREESPFYNRIQLPHYIDGSRAWRELALCNESQFEQLGACVHCGISIDAIDRKRRCVIDSRGREHGYDKLVLATGSRAALPSDADPSVPGVFTLRNREDAEALRERAEPGHQAVIVGGGLLGLELSAALNSLGARVTVLHRSARLMGAQVDETAAMLLIEELMDLGIEIILRDSIAVLHNEGGIRGLRTAAGRYLACDSLIYAVGTTPNDVLAREAGLQCGHGVIVDDGLCSSDPSILAIGEVAEWEGRRYGTTLAAQQQAEVAAARLGGDGWARYRGSIQLNVLKAPGIALASIGEVHLPVHAGPEYEEVTFLDRRERVYLKCIVYSNRLVGALLLGDTRLLPAYKTLIESGVELDDERSMLLRLAHDGPREPVRGKLVCSCNQVGEGNLETAVAEGCDSVERLCERTRAGASCGSCRPEVAQFLKACAAGAAS